MREDFAQQSACQMPEVARPHLLYGITLCKLRKNCVYPVAKATQQSAAFGSWISFLRGVGSQKLYAHALLGQLFSHFGRMVVAVSNDQAGGSLHDLRQHRKLVSLQAGATEMRVMTPGQQSLKCTLKP